MAKHAFPQLKIELDSSTGGLMNISAYVVQINGWNTERLVEEVTGAGDVTDRHAALGFLQKNEVELSGPYDDAAAGLVGLTKGWTDDTERSLKLTFDGTVAADVAIVECLLMRTQRNPSRGAFTQYAATLRPTGAIS